MLSWPRLSPRLAVIGAIFLGACAPGAVGASGALVGVTLFVGLVALLAPKARLGDRVARAGPPMPCDGYETPYCSEHGHIQKYCCPANAKCNYRDIPFIECGHGLCTNSADVGRCPAPKAWVDDEAKSEEECKKRSGDWELVCAERVVAGACLQAMPTNYMGPGRNPPFRTCGRGAKLVSIEGDVRPGDRCTTHLLDEDCYPLEGELGVRPCPGNWEKVCLGGKVGERCLPQPIPPSTAWRAAMYVSCDDGSCAIGDDKSKVCR